MRGHIGGKWLYSILIPSGEQVGYQLLFLFEANWFELHNTPHQHQIMF